MAFALTAAGLLLAVVPAVARTANEEGRRDPNSIQLQNEFDHIGAEVHSLTHAGRTSYYIDVGKPGERAVVFIGSQGTSLEAFQLSEFARTSREELGLRVISVERNVPGAIVDASRITSPTYPYWGGADTTVPTTVMQKWQAALPNIKRATVYPNDGHTVQYRHWDQILVDMAGYTDHTVVCTNGQTKLVPNDRADEILRRGATLGLCAWVATP